MAVYPPHLDPEALLDFAAVLVVHLDRTGRVLWANRAFEVLAGWPPGGIRGRDWFSTFVPRYQAEFARVRFEHALAGRSGTPVTNTLVARDGTEHRVQWRNRRLSQEGEPGVLAVGMELPAGLHGEPPPGEPHRDAQSDESQFADAPFSARAGSWTLELASGELSWSDEIFQIFELDKALFGASYAAFLECVHPDDRGAVDAAFKTSLEKRTPYEIVHRLLMPDDRIKWVHERGEAVYDDRGRSIRYIGTVQDVTAAVLTEQIAAVKTAAIESSNNAIAFADLVGRITYVNATFVRLWGARHPDDLLGRDACDLWECCNERAPAGLPAGTGSWAGEVKATTLDGSTLVVQGSIHLVKDPLGRASAVMASFIDITQRVEFERQLAARLSEKEVLLREIHHRVKNNLQIISSMLHFESKRSSSRDPAQTFADLRKRLLAMTLVHEKLYQSRNLALVDFGEYVRSLVRAIATSFEREHAVAFDVASDPVALPIEVALPAGMIVCELVTNVLKYAFPENQRGAAAVAICASGDRVFVEVNDDGIGFPTGFEIGDGGSFGLELVRSLTTQLGGELEATSSRGVHVRVGFPFRPQRTTEPPAGRLS